MPPINRFGPNAKSIDSTADDVLLVTPSDSVDLTYLAKAIRLSGTGTAGNVSVITDSGNTRTIPMLPGEQWNVCIRRVLSTGTTATGIYVFV